MLSITIIVLSNILEFIEIYVNNSAQ